MTGSSRKIVGKWEDTRMERSSWKEHDWAPTGPRFGAQIFDPHFLLRSVDLFPTATTFGALGTEN